MLIEDHEETSLIMFGRRYSEVHSYLDQYFPLFGPYHRVVLHHRQGIELIKTKFKGPSGQVAEQHIIEDLGQVPYDWNHFDFDLEYADTWLSQKTRMEKGTLIDLLRRLYPQD